MFTNIGAKIKGLAKAGCWVGIVGCIFAGVVLLFTAEEFIPIGFGVAVGGGLASWIGSWFLYGFGQLIENSDVIAAHYQKINASEEQRQQQQIKKDRQARQKRNHDPCRKLLFRPLPQKFFFILGIPDMKMNKIDIDKFRFRMYLKTRMKQGGFYEMFHKENQSHKQKYHG